MIPGPPVSTRTDTLFPNTTLSRSAQLGARLLLLQHGFAADEGVLLQVDEAVEPRLGRRVDRAVLARPGPVALLQPQGKDGSEAKLAQAEILAGRQQVVIETAQDRKSVV